MPYGVYPVPKARESGNSGRRAQGLPVRILTRIRRSRLDSQLAHGAGSPASPELQLREGQLRSTAERTRIANALVEAVGDARSGEPVTLRPRAHRAVVREAADDVLALALRLREDRPTGIEGVARAALLIDDKTSPMHRGDADELRDAVRSTLSALDATPELRREIHAQAA